MELVRASEGGRIEEPYFPLYPLRNEELPRRSRPASFYACSGCEYCEEATGSEREPIASGDERGSE